MTKKNWNNAGVYSITNLKTGRIYVAASKNMQDAVKLDRRKLKAGTHHNAELQADFIFFPDTLVFKVLGLVESTDQFVLERSAHNWMTELRSFIDAGGYNNPDDHLVKPRTSTLKGKKRAPFSDETRRKMSLAKLGKKRIKKQD